MSYILEGRGNRTIIIGQAPAASDDPRHPISGKTGKRLADLMGLSMNKFHERYDRCNLIDHWPGRKGKGDAFPIDLAKASALILRDHILDIYPRILLLGRGVARAFDVPKDTCFCEWFRHVCLPRHFAVLPHPSGINRWWNEPVNVEQARQFLVSLNEESA